MSTTDIKAEAKRLIDQLPDTMTWDDLMREIGIRQAIEKGLEDSQQGRTTSVEDVRKQFGLPQ